MNLIPDLIVLAILGFCIWNGKRRGFIKTFFGLFGSLIAFVLAAVTAKPVGNLIGNLIYAPMKEHFLSSLAERTGESVDKIDFSALPESCNELLARFGMNSESLAQRVSEYVTEGSQITGESVAEYVVRPVANSVGFAIAAILLFVVFYIAIRIAVHFFDLVAKLPGLNFSNRFLGLFAGALQGIFLVLLISTVLVKAAPAFPEEGILAMLNPQNSILVKLFGNIDLLGVFTGTKGSLN